MIQPPTARPALAPIPFDLACLGCRYNLRTMPVEAVCPECALPIRRTLEHGWLIFADSAWLWRVRGGLSSLLLSLLVWPVGIAGIVLYTVVSAGGEPDEVVLGVLTLATGLAFIALLLFGVWGVTSPEPLSNPGRMKTNLGHWIRALNVAAIVTAVVGVCVSSGTHEITAPDIIKVLSIIGVGAVGGSAYLLGFLLLLVHMRRLARRVSKPSLGNLLSFILWSGIGFTALTLGGVVTAAVIGGRGVAPVSGPSSAPSPTTMNVRVRPMAVSVEWPSPASAPASGPAQIVSPTTTPTAPGAVMPPRMPAVMFLSVAFAVAFYLFVLALGGAWLLALISFRRILKQTIRENSAATYNAWLHPIPSPPQAT
ncbi:MAG TPA: hypothetical protein VJZ71_19795 [Phycisphaerae bacterium]|nr:hypothetical protein [Phycisphaerae bacterium]